MPIQPAEASFPDSPIGRVCVRCKKPRDTLIGRLCQRCKDKSRYRVRAKRVGESYADYLARRYPSEGR